MGIVVLSVENIHYCDSLASCTLNTFDEFANQADYDSQQDLVGLAVFWISAYNGQDVVPISDVHDILTLYEFRLSEQAVAIRMKQLKDEGLGYYKERSGIHSGFQLSELGFKRYDELSGDCLGMRENGSDSAPTWREFTYQDILRVINDAGTGFEHSSKWFRDKEEEELRGIILTVLRSNFKSGTATGETFNKDGKSDILLRTDDGTNLFIAECAIWGGEKYFTGKIDQLNRYLTWRDTKAAVIMFVQNQKMVPVCEQIEHGVENHDQFVEKVDQPSESWWQYRFHFENDPDRELNLAVLAFHLPPE